MPTTPSVLPGPHTADLALPGLKRSAALPAPEQRIYERLVQAIVEQRLTPGTRLPEQRLSALFGVSRERMRRVLLRLSEAHYLELVPNVGARVWRPSPDEVRQIFEARAAVERQTVRAACLRWERAAEQGAAEAELRALLEAEAQARARQDRAAAIRLSGEFHLQIAGLAGNALLLRFLRELVALSSLALTLYGRRSGEAGGRESGHACAEHDGLLRALAAGDPKRAERLMVRHLEAIEANLDMLAGARGRAAGTRPAPAPPALTLEEALLPLTGSALDAPPRTAS